MCTGLYTKLVLRACALHHRGIDESDLIYGSGDPCACTRAIASRFQVESFSWEEFCHISRVYELAYIELALRASALHHISLIHLGLFWYLCRCNSKMEGSRTQ